MAAKPSDVINTKQHLSIVNETVIEISAKALAVDLLEPPGHPYGGGSHNLHTVPSGLIGTLLLRRPSATIDDVNDNGMMPSKKQVLTIAKVSTRG